MLETANAMVPDIEEADSQDPELQDFATQVDSSKNYAKDEGVKKYILEHILDVVTQTRMDMIPNHQEWLAVARMVTLDHDSGQKYIGRSNAYIPSYARARQTLVSTLSQGLFPSDEYMSVTDKERPQDSNAPNALAVKTALQWQFQKVAKLRSKVKPFLGEFVDYGNAVAKVWYEKPSAGEGTTQGRSVIPDLNGRTESYKKVAAGEGLRFSTRSLYDFYVYPMNVDSLEGATLVFEDLEVSRAYVLERQRRKEWENCDQALNAQVVSEHLQTSQERSLQQSEVPGSSTQGRHAGSDIGDFRTFTELYCRIPLPDDAYLEDEEVGTPLPTLIVMTGDIILRVCRNPFWHQMPPYLVSREDPKPGHFWSKGTGHRVKSLQYLVNDFANQLNDNGTYALNPVVLVNPSLQAGPLAPLKPGVVWPTLDTEKGIKFDRPPIEQIRDGQGLVSLYSGMVADHAGAPPSLEGSGGGKNAKTATGAQLLQKNAMNPLRDMVEDIENDVFTPLMFMTWVLMQQYCEPKWISEIMAGDGSVTFVPQKKEDILGDFEFIWAASTQAANQAQRAQQGIQILQILTPPLVQMLMQAGHQVDPYVLLKRIYSDGLGFRDFDKFIKDAPLGPTGMPPGQPPGLPPGGAGPGGDGSSPPGVPPPQGGGQEPRSAVMQAGQPPHGASTMAPGEDDVLGPLRRQVEAETAKQGGQR